MDKFIKKHRIIKNNIELVLFEKTIIKDLEVSAEVSLTPEQQIIENKTYVEYDDKVITEQLNNISDTIINQRVVHTIYDLHSRQIHLPFAVRNDLSHSWGGDGKAGIFWHDPGEDADDVYSIKVGKNNTDIDELGYSAVGFGAVTDLAMSFQMGGVNRGFVWRRRHAEEVESIMSLDVNWKSTSNSDENNRGYRPKGDLTVFGNVDTYSGYFIQSDYIGWDRFGEIGGFSGGVDNYTGKVLVTAVHPDNTKSATTVILELQDSSGTAESLFGFPLSAQTIDAGNNEEVIIFNGSSGEWYVSALTATTGGGGTIDDLSDVIVATPSAGERLIYTSGAWQNESSAHTHTYVNATEMPEAIHGIDAGTTWDNTIQEVLDAILYPYQTPVISNLVMANQSTSLECGNSIATSKTFTWNTSNPTNLVANTITIKDSTEDVILTASTNDDNTETLTISGSPLIKSGSTSASHYWSITGETSQGESTGDLYSVTWRWRTYWGSSTDSSATEDMITGGSLENSSILYTSYARDYTCPNETASYKWICWPQSFGTATTFKDTSTNLDIPFETEESLDVMNVYGYITSYYAYRSTNALGSEVEIEVSA